MYVTEVPIVDVLRDSINKIFDNIRKTSWILEVARQFMVRSELLYKADISTIFLKMC